nr:zinc finger, CCHC-type, retrotransposon Gag domain protein [Tanacetum cinerariifolium]
MRHQYHDSSAPYFLFMSCTADGEHTYRYRPLCGCTERLASFPSSDSRGDPRRVPYWIWIVECCGNPPPVTIHTWLERFNKQKPHSFEKATAPVDAENWISHMEKIFDVMGCEDAFKTRLAVYKFEGNALAWWKAYKQAKGGDAWLVTVTWADLKKLFFL